MIYLIAGLAYGVGVFIAYQMGKRAGMRSAVLIIARMPPLGAKPFPVKDMEPCLICGEPVPPGIKCGCWLREKEN